MKQSEDDALQNQLVIARIIGLNWSRKVIRDWVEGNWGSQVAIKFIPKGFFVVLFEKESVRDSILNHQNWIVNRHALYLQSWTPNFNPIPLVHYSNSVWIRLYNLPIEYWGDGLLEKVGRTLGTLLEVDVDDEADLCKYVRLRIAAVRRIPESINLLTTNGEWSQQLEIEKEICQCQRCGSRMHGEDDCKMFVGKASKVFRKLVQNWKHKTVSLEKMVTGTVMQTVVVQSGSKEKVAESMSKAVGEATKAIGDEVTFNPGKAFEFKSDTEFEYDKGSDEDFLQEDELDNVDSRCISQSANVLLEKSKGFRGRWSNRRLREDRANEKGIISIMDFMKKAKGDR
ncbi:hypothetical protein SUGI_0317120 [Cryptomeria japonica]|nr:hypothetical protein SUGI_0317120 [Cryptomeria japonica]